MRTISQINTMGNKKINDQTREIKIESQRDPKRSHWYLLSGILLGIAAGLILAWLIFPVVYEDTSPASLSEGYKEIYRRAVAEAYAATGDLGRAKSRLNLLENDDVVFALGAQAQRALAAGRDKEAQALALLASTIQSGESSGESIPTLVTPSETPDEPDIPTQTLQQIEAEP